MSWLDDIFGDFGDSGDSIDTSSGSGFDSSQWGSYEPDQSYATDWGSYEPDQSYATDWGSLISPGYSTVDNWADFQLTPDPTTGQLSQDPFGAISNSSDPLFDYNFYSPDGDTSNLDFLGALNSSGNSSSSGGGLLSGLGSLLNSSTLKGLLGTGLTAAQVAGAFQGNKGSNAELATPQVAATPMTWGGTGAAPQNAVSENNDPFTNDWNRAFQGKQAGFGAGQTMDWGGGKLTNNSGQFSYADPSGETFRFNQNTNPSQLMNNPNIREYWENQYGVDNTPAASGNALLPLNKASGGGVAGPQARPRGALGLLRGGSTGQQDDVPINASHGEYVFDADTVSALGDGNTDAGAKVLDAMRVNIRKHKRKASSTSIPPKAKSPAAYLKGTR